MHPAQNNPLTDKEVIHLNKINMAEKRGKSRQAIRLIEEFKAMRKRSEESSKK